MNFVTWHIILLEETIRKWVHCGDRGMNAVSNNVQEGQCLNDAQSVPRKYIIRCSLHTLVVMNG